jgi:hypothetical protein
MDTKPITKGANKMRRRRPRKFQDRLTNNIIRGMFSVFMFVIMGVLIATVNVDVNIKLTKKKSGVIENVGSVLDSVHTTYKTVKNLVD